VKSVGHSRGNLLQIARFETAMRSVSRGPLWAEIRELILVAAHMILVRVTVLRGFRTPKHKLTSGQKSAETSTLAGVLLVCR